MLKFTNNQLTNEKGAVIVDKYTYNIAMGNIPERNFVRKFGWNSNSANGVTETIWDGSNAYPFYPSNGAGATVTVSGTVNDDYALNAGARKIKIYGLDENWNLQEEELQLSGTTAISSSGTYKRVFRAYTTLVGDIGYNSGTIDVTLASQSSMKILAGNGQTQMAIYTIPLGYEGYIIQWRGAVVADNNTNNKVGTLLLKTHQRMVSGTSDGGVRIRDVIGKRNDHVIHDLKFPIKVSEKTDVYIDAISNTASTQITGGFDILLKKVS